MMKKAILAVMLLAASLLLWAVPAMALAVPDVAPYARCHTVLYTEPVSIGGVSCSDAIGFIMGYTGYTNGDIAEVAYNFDGKYSSMSFCAGYILGDERAAKLYVEADGRQVINTEVGYESARAFNVSLVGVNQLVIRMQSDEYDKTRFGIGNVQLQAAQVLPEEEPKLSDEFYDVTRTDAMNVTVVTETFEMGGEKFTNGYNFKMGYTGSTSTGNKAKATFDFNNQYKELEFDVCRYSAGNDQSYRRSAWLTIEADGKVISGYDAREIKWNDLCLHVKVNLSGVKQLTITMTNEKYEKKNWRIGNIQLVSDGKVHGVLLAKDSVTLSSSNPEIDLNPRIYPSDAPGRELGFDIATGAAIIAMADPDGLVLGRHKGDTVITVTTREGGYTAECAVKCTMAAAKFVPSVDGWGFGNTTLNPNSDTFKEHMGDVYRRVSDIHYIHDLYDMMGISGLAKYISFEDYWWNCIVTSTMQGGICNGMSLSAALTYMDALPFELWDWSDVGITRPADVMEFTDDGYSEKIDLNLAQAIIACQIASGSRPYIISEYSNCNDYEGLFKAVRNFKTTGRNPVILNMNKKGVCHALLPYDMIERDGEIRMFIYDPNARNFPQDDPDSFYISFKLNADGDVYNWSYTKGNLWVYQKSNTDLHYVGTLNRFADRITKGQKFDFPTNVVHTDAKKFDIIQNGVTVISYSDGKFSGGENQDTVFPLMLAGAVGESGWPDGAAVCLSDDAEVSIRIEDTGRVNTAYYGSGYACVFTSGGDATIRKIGGTDALQITPASGDTVRMHWNGSEGYTIAQGKAAGTITVSGAADGVTLSGYSTLQTITVEDGVEKPGEMQKLTGNKVYAVNGDGSIISGDADNAIGDSAFENCRLLPEYTLPEDTTMIGSYAFRNCTGIRTLRIPAKVVFIGKGAFDGCSGLTLVVTEGSYAHEYCRQNNLTYTLAK